MRQRSAIPRIGNHLTYQKALFYQLLQKICADRVIHAEGVFYSLHKLQKSLLLFIKDLHDEIYDRGFENRYIFSASFLLICCKQSLIRDDEPVMVNVRGVIYTQSQFIADIRIPMEKPY
ncbi:hypothetical protein D3C74_296480 [compost metagenome]